MGRFECVFDKQNITYMGEGDIAINSMYHLPKESTIPLRRFYGSSIILFPEVIGENLFLKEAGIELATTDKKISDIALELSYKNPSKFAEAFTSVMGCTPTEYRKLHMECARL